MGKYLTGEGSRRQVKKREFSREVCYNRKQINGVTPGEKQNRKNLSLLFSRWKKQQRFACREEWATREAAFRRKEEGSRNALDSASRNKI